MKLLIEFIDGDEKVFEVNNDQGRFFLNWLTNGETEACKLKTENDIYYIIRSSIKYIKEV
ncbi:hypothetical protein [Dethiothermospora halolimnae]|uniref:hypothetical protein n=1 Tax=Dethiothermospora halolimnae TaxID=3114390 RepID=UPI003CCBBF61